MKNETEITLDYYNELAQDFTDSTVNVDFSEIQQQFTSMLKPGAHILDFGCGSGRDSKAFIQKGYRITAVDGSKELCEIAGRNIGQPVIHSLFQDYQPEEKFDGIWACASLLHLEKNVLERVIRTLAGAIRNGGVFYMSFKYGTHAGLRNGRFFTDLTEETLAELMAGIPSLRLVKQEITEDVRKDHAGQRWLNAYYVKAGG